MDIVKKNLISFICAAVALIALIALFFPTSGWFSDLEERMQARARVHSDMRNLLNKQRSAPVIDLNSSDAVPLDGFPSKTFIEKGKEVTKKVEEQSQQMYRAAVQMNRKPLLVEGVLPQSGDTPKFKFRGDYRRMMTEVLPKQILQSGTPPTPEAIQARREALWNEKYKPQIQVYPGGMTNEPKVQEEFRIESEKLPQVMTEEIATSAKIYLDPTALTIQPGFEGSRSPTPEDIWWAQQGLWIQQEVANAIAAANEKAQNITTAPVKHLIALQVPANYIFPATVTPTTVPPDPTQPITPAPAVSATARASNQMYDVVHFKLQVIVDAAEIPTLFRELSRNRFITVTRVEELAAVDSAAAKAQGFLYGASPVVRLSLNCEVLLLREWTVPLMPPTILQRLGIQPAGGAQPMARF